ncbi:MAG: nitrogen fixation protein [Cyanosarcina radialis HA8281-LM2]|jgi:hypothetical protein|nr:nitrogen fixation protein [Cyanosarcina radialis HA8281-LM2]
MESKVKHPSPLCPSSRPDLTDSFVFGIAAGTVDEVRVHYLPKPQPVTDELMALAAPATPTEVFRFAASCVGNNCVHFDGANCRLVQKIVEKLDAVTDLLPPCQIRQSCRWWQQEGKAACQRCPQIATDRCQS